jgi:hypothetical protein
MTGFHVEAIGDWGRAVVPPPTPGFRKDRSGVAGVWKPMFAPSSWIERKTPASPSIHPNSAAAVDWLNREVNVGIPAHNDLGGNPKPAIAALGTVFSTGGSSPNPLLGSASDTFVAIAIVGSSGQNNGGVLAANVVGSAPNQSIDPTAPLKYKLANWYGAPIPGGTLPIGNPGRYKSPGGTDSPFTIFLPDWTGTDASVPGGTGHGLIIECWRLWDAGTQWQNNITNGIANTGVNPANLKDPNGNPILWEAQSYMVIRGVNENPGQPLDRYLTAAATSPQLALAESSALGTSASHDPLMGTMIFEEDVQLWNANLAAAGGNPDLAEPPPHSWGFSSYWHPPDDVWPALGHDATIGIDSSSPVITGMRYWLPRPSQGGPLINNLTGGPMAGGKLHPLTQMLCRQAQEYTAICMDHGGSVAIKAEHTIPNYFNGIGGGKVLQGMPWSQMRVLQPGTNTTPFP